MVWIKKKKRERYKSVMTVQTLDVSDLIYNTKILVYLIKTVRMNTVSKCEMIAIQSL